MDAIKLKLYQPFVVALNKMKNKYGEDFEKLNGFHLSNLNFSDFIDNFIDKNNNIVDISVNPNANSDIKDITSLIHNMTEPHCKLLSYNKIFYEITKKYGLQIANDWFENEWNGCLYLHDGSTASFEPYCWATDLDKLVEKGLFFTGKFKTQPAKHLTTFHDHLLEYIGWLSNRQSGAVGIPSYFIYSYYFWYNDIKNNYYLKNPEYYRKQCFQKLIYDLNQPYLRVIQSAFTNVSIMDRNYISELFGDRQYPDGEYVIDHIDDIIEHQKIFMETISEIRENMMFTFPVITYSLLFKNGKFVDEEFAKWCCNHNMKWCDANFYIGDNVTSLSSCCRLVSDTTQLNAFINSIGGTSLCIGSVKVNTINLRRIALDSNKDKNKYFELLNEKLDLCIKTLDIVRNIIKRNIEKGLLPNYHYGLVELEKQYCTIGITAMYETIREFGFVNTDEFENKSYSEEGIKFACEIMDFINQKKNTYNFDYSFNIEAIPAENANVKLCIKDNLLYSEQEQDFIYSNQWVPLQEKCTLNEKIKLGAILDKKCGGGQISHINVQGDFANEEQSWNLLNYIANKGVIYFAYNKAISVCEDEHAFFGDICPKCGKYVKDTFCRVVGFLTPISSYSKERKEEFKNRKWFDLNND